MEKFKKLSRDEMRKISGGETGCPAGSFVHCNCPGVPLSCEAMVDDCPFTPAQNCEDLHGCPGFGCFEDDGCSIGAGC